MRDILGAAAVLLAVGLLAGWGETKPGAASAEPAAGSPGRATRSCKGEKQVLGDRRVSYAALALRRTVSYRAPGADRLASFGVENVNGHVTVFEVKRVVLDRDCDIAWYRVALPIRPNGSEGYVRAGDVSLIRLHTRIVVDLSQRQLTFFKYGRRLLRAPVAIGAPKTRTPTGRFYVNQRIIPREPNGPWGPGAIGISAFSDVLRGWAQGGPIAIHGTNTPATIGKPVSHGCMRLANKMLRRIFGVAKPGTPVIIHA